MIDLNAKKLKREQAKRNPRYTESHTPSKWDIPLFFASGITFILISIIGV
ncbi:hypothetical protein [uncultured Gilliamella sp.]|nr:hypothetical protein [uncultured Gilliamella sp.]